MWSLPVQRPWIGLVRWNPTPPPGAQHGVSIPGLRLAETDALPTELPGAQFKGSALSHFDPFSEEYDNSIILKAPLKTCDLDPVPTSLFTKCVDDLCIFKKSLNDGSVPACFKSALETPSLKKPTFDHNDLKNLAFFFVKKILEKIVLDQLKSHLATNQLLESLQSAHQAEHGTETALLKVMNGVLTDCDSGKVSTVYLTA